MWPVRQALMQAHGEAKLHLDKQLILCGTAEFPGSLVYENFRSGNLSISAGLLSALQRVGAKHDADVLVSGVQGNHYNAIGLLTDGAPFDVHVPEWPRMPDKDLPLLPLRIVEELLRDELKEFQLFASKLRILGYRCFMHLSAPPPVPDAEFIRSKLPLLPSGDLPEVSAADVRLKLWTIQQRMVRKAVEEHGGILLGPPSGTQDGDGFLKREYWKDSVHANAAYAALQLDQIHSVMLRLQQDEGPQHG
jgi:hypothetical protein